MKKQTSAKPDLFYYITFALLVLTEAVLIAFVHARASMLTDSDAASELLLGRILADEGKLMTTSWYYSTEVRVCGVQIVYALLFRFLQSWHMVRVLSTLIFHVLLLVSLWYLCRQSGLGRMFPLAGLCLLLPLSRDYFMFMIFGCYYIPYVAISFFTVGMALGYVREKGRRRTLLLVLACILAAVAGLGGLRQVAQLYVPLVATAALLFFMNWYRSGWKESIDGTAGRLLLFTGLCFLTSGIGYVINSAVIARIYSFESWDEVIFQDFDLGRLLITCNGVLHAFGYVSGPLGLHSLGHNAICALLLVLLLYLTVSCIRHWHEQILPGFLALFMVVNLAVLLVLNSFTNMLLTERYLIPVLIFVPVIALHGVRIADFGKLPRRTGAVLTAVMCALVCAKGAFLTENMYHVDRNWEVRKVTAFLEDAGYHSGYATFWNGNLLTELTDGDLEMYVWYLADPDGIGMEQTESVDDLYAWLQKKSHFEAPPEGRVFILLGKKEQKRCKFRRSLSEEDIVFKSDNYTVYGYESYAAMKQILDGKD